VGSLLDQLAVVFVDLESPEVRDAGCVASVEVAEAVGQAEGVSDTAVFDWLAQRQVNRTATT